eukprot:621326-Amphidinium_carterae.1
MITTACPRGRISQNGPGVFGRGYTNKQDHRRPSTPIEEHQVDNSSTHNDVNVIAFVGGCMVFKA